MRTIEDLKAEMVLLQAEVSRISSEGRVLVDCWIAQAKPGSKKNKYPRLKSRKPIFNGKKTEYLSIQGDAIAEAQAAIERGRTVKKLKKRIQTLGDRLNAMTRKSPKNPSADLQKPFKRGYPPSALVDLARQVMGNIDLAPVCDAIAQQSVQSTTYYTPEQDGLSQPWQGRVWLYPPSTSKAGKWAKKAIAEYELGNMSEAILLVKSSPNSKWFQKLIRLFSACFLNEPLQFLDEQGNPQPKPQSNHALFYLGQNVEQFKQVFGAIGSVSSPV